MVEIAFEKFDGGAWLVINDKKECVGIYDRLHKARQSVAINAYLGRVKMSCR